MRRFQGCFVAILLGLLAHPAGAADPAAKPAVKPLVEPKLTVVNVSSHCDWSWTHTRAWHEARYADIIRSVLLIMRDHPNYVWQLENENEELAPFLKKAKAEWPELIDEFWRRVREGRIEVIVGISDPRLSEVYPETTVRNLVLGKQYFRRHAPGIEQKVYDAVDLMCGPSQMPQILAQAGYRYFMFSRPIGPQATFWRTGLDGTRMLTSRSFYGYHTQGRPGEVVQGIAPAPIWRVAVGEDDQLPDPKLPVQATAWDAQKKVITTLARYFEEVEKSGAKLTEFSGMLDSLECYIEAGMHGNRSLYTLNNQDEDLLVLAEKVQAATALMGHVAAKQPPMDELWHDVLACIGHAIQWAWKEDYEERIQFAQRRREKIDQAIQQSLASLAAGIRFPPGSGTPVVVFNDKSWPVTGVAQVIGLNRVGKNVALYDTAGREIPIQGSVENGSGPSAFLAENVPACGYKTYYLRPRDAAPPSQPQFATGRGPIENETYQVRVLDDGRLEVRDRQRGVTLGDVAQGGLGDVVFYDAPESKSWLMNGPLGARHSWTVQEKDIQCLTGPVVSTLRVTGTLGPHKIVREVRLARKSRRIDFHVEIEAAEDSGVFSIRFPTGLAGRVVAGIPFGVEPRADFAKEPFRGEFFVRGYPDGYYATRWTDVSSDDYGYTFVCPSGMHSGYAFHPADKSLEFILLRVRKLPSDVFRQMAPSVCGTGPHTFDCALVPHPATWREAATYQAALEVHAPLRAFVPPGATGCLSASADTTRVGKPPVAPNSPAPNNGLSKDSINDEASLVDVRPTGVVLSSARLVEPADPAAPREVELRLYETLGRAADVTVRLGGKVRAVRETNFLGESADASSPIRVEGSEIRFSIRPWKIVTLRVACGGG